MLELLNSLKVLRILTEGTSIGAAVGGAVSFFSSNEGISMAHGLFIGGLAGKGLQDLLQYFVGPRLAKRRLRTDLEELISLREDGLIDWQTCQLVMDQLIKKRFSTNVSPNIGHQQNA